MCTAACFHPHDFYFGRNLDYECSYGESITLTPRGYRFALRCMGKMHTRYAILGMAHVAGEYPLYYDAFNETGLCIAGLNFVGNAAFFAPVPGKTNITTFELIPWLLGTCADLQQARKALQNLNLVSIPFSDQLPLSQLHWMIADRTGCLVLESTADGLHLYENPAKVLANNPPFPQQMAHLNCYRSLSVSTPAEASFAPGLSLPALSRGMGAMGLPGDLSSPSRFVRAAFTAGNSLCGADEASAVNQFFHILTSVEQQRGCCRLGSEEYEITIYSSCCNADKGIYYYTTYENRQITAVEMQRCDLDSQKLQSWPMLQRSNILLQN